MKNCEKNETFNERSSHEIQNSLILIAHVLGYFEHLRYIYFALIVKISVSQCIQCFGLLFNMLHCFAPIRLTMQIHTVLLIKLLLYM